MLFTIVNIVKTMTREIKGKIIASTIADFGETDIKYGYIGVEPQKGEHIRVKVDSYTSYETLDLGENVILEVENLGDTDIIIARKITRVKSIPETAEMTATASS